MDLSRHIKTKWIKPPVFALCLAPLAQLTWTALHNGLGANPVEAITHSTGTWTLVFLCVTLKVTSSCLCKKSEGAVLPLLIEPLKNRIDDSLHAGHIHEQHHGPGAPADFHEASFDGIGGAQLAPQRLREIEERQQFGQIALQPAHQCRIDPLPAKPKSLEGATGLRGVARQIDALRIAFDLRLVAAPYAVAQVAHPVHPTALVTRAGVDGFDGRGQTRTAIAEHHPKLTAGQSALVQIPQKGLPGRLAFAPGTGERQQLPRAVATHAVGHQQQYPLGPKGPPHLQPDSIQQQVNPVIFQRRAMEFFRVAFASALGPRNSRGLPLETLGTAPCYSRVASGVGAPFTGDFVAHHNKTYTLSLFYTEEVTSPHFTTRAQVREVCSGDV